MVAVRLCALSLSLFLPLAGFRLSFVLLAKGRWLLLVLLEMLLLLLLLLVLLLLLLGQATLGKRGREASRCNLV
jgi:hypothetical protein